jgi:hypothetical protein
MFVEAGAGFAPTPWFEAGASALISNNVGVKVWARFVPINQDGALKPVFGVHFPYYAPEGQAVVGAGASIGARWDALSWLAFTVDVPVEYYFLKSDRVKSIVLLGTAGAQVRL